MILNIPFRSPPERPEIADSEVHVFYASLDQPPARLEQLAEQLSEDERARASRFIYNHDKNRFVAGRGMLREILGWLLQVKPDDLSFSYNSHGKPQLAAPLTGNILHFNLAHSGSLAVYAVSRKSEIGIDIERIRPIYEAEEIAAQFFSKQECAQWRSFPAEQKAGAFFNCWTRKEAWLKACGEGIGERLKQTEVFFAGDFFDSAQYLVRSLPLGLDYAAAVAIKSREARVNCWKWQRTIEG